MMGKPKMMEIEETLIARNVKEITIEMTEKTKITKTERKETLSQHIEKIETARKAIIEKSLETEEKITKKIMKTHCLIRKTSP